MPNVTARWSQEKLVAEIRREKSARRRDRLRVVLWAMRGESIGHIAARLGHGAGYVKRWVGRWNAEGPDGLLNRPRLGQPKFLPTEREQEFRDRIVAGPDPARDGRISAFTGADARRILAEQFGAVYTLAGAYALLHRLGLTWLSPRPRHRKADRAARKEWVERTAPLLSKKPANNSPTKTSKSGSRTRRGSARRGR